METVEDKIINHVKAGPETSDQVRYYKIISEFESSNYDSLKDLRDLFEILAKNDMPFYLSLDFPYIVDTMVNLMKQSYNDGEKVQLISQVLYKIKEISFTALERLLNDDAFAAMKRILMRYNDESICYYLYCIIEFIKNEYSEVLVLIKKFDMEVQIFDIYFKSDIDNNRRAAISLLAVVGNKKYVDEIVKIMRDIRPNELPWPIYFNYSLYLLTILAEKDYAACLLKELINNDYLKWIMEVYDNNQSLKLHDSKFNDYLVAIISYLAEFVTDSDFHYFEETEIFELILNKYQYNQCKTDPESRPTCEMLNMLFNYLTKSPQVFKNKILELNGCEMIEEFMENGCFETRIHATDTYFNLLCDDPESLGDLKDNLLTLALTNLEDLPPDVAADILKSMREMINKYGADYLNFGTVDKNILGRYTESEYPELAEMAFILVESLA